MNIRKIKRSLERVIPPSVLDLMISSFVFLRFWLSDDRQLLGVNSELKKYKKNKRAFILATGPSVKKQDLKFLKGEDSFSISNFYLHEDIDTIKPSLHFFAPYHEPLELQNYIDWLKQSDQNLPASTDIVLGCKEEALVRKHGLFQERKVYYLYMDRVDPKFPIRLDRPLPHPKTGPQMILPTLISLGYEEIFLIGCDHTVLRDYGKTITNFYPANKDMRKNATSGDAWPSIINQLRGNADLFELYYAYKRIIDQNYPNIKVYNLSNDSWLDCFEFQDFDRLIKN